MIDENEKVDVNAVDSNDINSNAEINNEDLLLVSGSHGSKGLDKDYVKKLSNAVLKVFYKYNTVKLRCVGAASLNNAIKAVIIAKAEAEKEEIFLAIDPSFTTVFFGDEEKTGIVVEVFSCQKQ